jgi:hypothetical protein
LGCASCTIDSASILSASSRALTCSSRAVVVGSRDCRALTSRIRSTISFVADWSPHQRDRAARVGRASRRRARCRTSSLTSAADPVLRHLGAGQARHHRERVRSRIAAVGHAASRGIEHSLLRRRPRGTRGRATWRASDRCRVQARLRRVRLAAKRAANRRHRQRTRPPGWTAGRTTPPARLRRGAPRERAVARDRHHGRQLGRRPPASSRGKRMRHRSRRLTREHHARERAAPSTHPHVAPTRRSQVARRRRLRGGRWRASFLRERASRRL